MNTLERSVVHAMPKVELHVHLEGSFSGEAVARMAEEVGEPLPRPVDRLFKFPGFDAFLSFLTWTCNLVRTPEMAERAAYNFALRAKGENIIYAEIIMNPAHWERWAVEPLVEAISAGFDRAEGEGLPDIRLLLSILREQSAAEAMELVEWLGAKRPSRVVGLSIDGNEAREERSGLRFAPAFARARELGIPRTVHAGESSGYEGVLDALDLLGADRIDHGVRAVERPEVVKRLAEEQKTLNICLTSNLEYLYSSLSEHPLGDLVEAGVPVTINTDDPGFLGVDLTDEMLTAAELCDWGLEDLMAMTRRAIDASFCGPDKKKELRGKVG